MRIILYILVDMLILYKNIYNHTVIIYMYVFYEFVYIHFVHTDIANFVHSVHTYINKLRRRIDQY